MGKKALLTLATGIIAVTLATVGLTHALFTGGVAINANATTGTINVNWRSFDGIPSATTNQGPGNTQATCTAAVSTNGKTLTLNVNNAYPGLQCTFVDKYGEDGTLWTKLDPSQLPAFFTGPVTIAPGVVLTESGLTWNKVLQHGWEDQGTFYITVNNDAVQGGNYSYSIPLHFVQTDVNGH